MKDFIDKRNEREKMGKSIIKYWNVKYTPLTEQTPSKEASEDKKENCTPKTLQADKGEDLLPPREIESAVSEEDVVTKRQIDRILHEKSDEVRHLVEEEKNEIFSR